jgi:cysteine desulfurase
MTITAPHSTPLYLDHAATTPVRPEVREAMLPFLSDEQFGNPSSGHALGRRARAALDGARRRIAAALACEPRDVVFTSGGTEADNLAVIGAALRARANGRPCRVVVSRTEHKAVIDAAHAVERLGGEARFLDVDADGRVDPRAATDALRAGVAILSVMWVNNETGVIQDISALTAAAVEAGVPFHTDAVQAVGKIPCAMGDLPITMLSLSAHKIGGPKGVGALLVRDADRLEPLQHGGGQQRGIRPGTENVAGAVGLATAVELAIAEREEAMARVRELRDRLAAGIAAAVPGAAVTGEGAQRAPHILHLTLPDLDGNALAIHLDQAGIACSTGSACSTGQASPSHVLTAMNVRPGRAAAPLRLSLAATTGDDTIAEVLRRIPAVVGQVRVLTAALRGADA